MVIVIILALVLLLTFGIVVFTGSPFVRTHKLPIQTALDLLEIGKESHLLDLGSGDGAVLIAAAERGASATGYELNLLMYIVSMWRTRKYRELVNINWGNMWNAPIDKNTGSIFVFLDSRFMKRLDRKLKQAGCNIKVASYSYAISDKTALKTENGVHLYQYSD